MFICYSVGMKYYFSFAFVIYLLHQHLVSAQARVRYANHITGNDTGNCTKDMPCKTLHHALFDNFTSNRDYVNCQVSPDFADNSIIMVENGTYQMEGFGLVLCNVSNITIQAVSPKGAIVQCGCFNCSIEDAKFGNVYLQRARDITFVGMVFERCGYNASNVFVRATTGLTFRNCEFR